MNAPSSSEACGRRTLISHFCAAQSSRVYASEYACLLVLGSAIVAAQQPQACVAPARAHHICAGPLILVHEWACGGDDESPAWSSVPQRQCWHAPSLLQEGNDHEDVHAPRAGAGLLHKLVLLESHHSAMLPNTTFCVAPLLYLVVLFGLLGGHRGALTGLPPLLHCIAGAAVCPKHTCLAACSAQLQLFDF